MQSIGLLSDHAPDEIPASHRDLAQCPPAAALTTVMSDGYPQTSVVWCDFDGRCLRVNTMRGFAKERNMRRDPRVTLLCYDPRQPLRYLEVRGTVAEMTEAGAADHLDALASKYAGQPVRFFGEVIPAIDEETPYGGRPPLAEQDEATRDWIAQAGDLIDGPAVIAVWEDALNGPAWDGTYSWIHSDLAPPNLLVREGRLRAVLDFGATGLGDPATDLNPAWSIFSEDSRHVFRDLAGADDGTWRRSRGIAISQAVGLVPYYAVTNPALSALGKRMLREILTDARRNG